jgi:hypothetical protein
MNDSRLWEAFSNPGPMAQTMPKWVWNLPLNGITREKIRQQFKGFKEEDKNGGVMIVHWANEGYFSDEFIQRCRWALIEARAAGLKIILWDENGFPSGFAGGLLAERYPEYLAKMLNMVSEEINGPIEYLPVRKDGIFMGAAAMDPESMEITDISEYYTAGPCRTIQVKAGKRLKIMEFYLETAPAKQFVKQERQLVDFLDRDAVEKFIELTHEQYYRHFSEFFGDTIVMILSLWNHCMSRTDPVQFRLVFILVQTPRRYQYHPAADR